MKNDAGMCRQTGDLARSKSLKEGGKHGTGLGSLELCRVAARIVQLNHLALNKWRHSKAHITCVAQTVQLNYPDVN